MKNLFTTLLLNCLIGQIGAQTYENWVWETFDSDKINILKDNHIRDIVFDKKGVAWVAFNSGAVARVDNKKWSLLPAREVNSWANDIDVDEDGNLWIAGGQGFVLNYTPGNDHWESLELPEPMQALVVACGNGGRILVGCSSNGRGCAYLWNKGKWSKIGQERQDVFSVAFDPAGNGIVSYRDSTFVYPLGRDGSLLSNAILLSGETFYNMSYDRYKRLWTSSYSEFDLNYFDDNEWFSPPPPPKEMNYDFNGKQMAVLHNVKTLTGDRVAVSTQMNASLGIYDPKKQKWLAYRLPLDAQDGVSCIAQSPDGSIWCGTWANGIKVLRPAVGKAN